MNYKKPLLSISFCLVVSLFLQIIHAQRLPDSVIEEMASREMRYRHFLWHTIRDQWNTYDQDTQQAIRDLGWEPPRPARDYRNGDIIAITDNNSGEDFLYMHRQMIRMVREILQDNNENYELTSWQYIPRPGDNEWPVPNYNQFTQTKTDNFYYNQISPMEDTFMDEDELRSMTLGQLGSRIEFTIHNWLHLRFSSESNVGYRPGSDGPFPYIDERWDDPSYDWLADTYSSHVNPVFWKLHGWVDDRIEDWRRANGLDDINWRGTWEGGPMDSLVDMLGLVQNCPFGFEEVEEGEQSQLMMDESGSPGPQSSFADDVQVNFQPIAKRAAPKVPKLLRSQKRKGT